MASRVNELLNWTGPTSAVRGGSVYQLPNGRQYFMNPRERARLEQVQRNRAGWDRTQNLFRAAGMGIPLAAVAAPALAGSFGGGAATGAVQGAATSAPAVAAPASAGMFNFNNLLRLGELGVGTVTNLLGQRSQNRALDRQLSAQERDQAAQMAYAREQDALRRQEFERQQEQLQRQWEAEEAFRQKQFAAQEEERLYARQLQDEREGRRRTYRSTIGDPALFRMAEILRLGGR